MSAEKFLLAVRVTDSDPADPSGEYLAPLLAEGARLHGAHPVSPWRVDCREPQDDGSVAVIFSCMAERVAS